MDDKDLNRQQENKCTCYDYFALLLALFIAVPAGIVLTSILFANIPDLCSLNDKMAIAINLGLISVLIIGIIAAIINCIRNEQKNGQQK
jgi:F0F1-type ATP synthase assembly protein I